MQIVELSGRLAAELALFAGAGFLFFALNDLAVDLIYFVRRGWRALTIYRWHNRRYAALLPLVEKPAFFAIFVPAWDESAVVASMLRATLKRIDHPNYRIFVGHYRNDPGTAAAIASVDDRRIESVVLPIDGPTTKADCLNHLYDALLAYEVSTGIAAIAVVLHDAEDVVHPLELRVFEHLIGRAALIQLPVHPLRDRGSPWVAGHYCDEFAESHAKELVVREAVGASIPLAGVGCAIGRRPLAAMAASQQGRPFIETSMTEDYEFGLRVGDLGLKTMFVRMRVLPRRRETVAVQGHFPSSIGAAVRQKARWMGGIALSGWDRLGWGGGLGERWMRFRDRRGPLSALFLLAGYGAAILWSQMWVAHLLGAPPQVKVGAPLHALLAVSAWVLLWRVLVRAAFTTSAYGIREGILAIPRVVIGNIIAVLAALRAVSIHFRGGPRQWEKTHHVFPRELPQ